MRIRSRFHWRRNLTAAVPATHIRTRETGSRRAADSERLWGATETQMPTGPVFRPPPPGTSRPDTVKSAVNFNNAAVCSQSCEAEWVAADGSLRPRAL